MTRRRLDPRFCQLSSEDLMKIFDNIGTRPCDRVKKTGHVKLSMAKFGDQILDEVQRRREAEA